MFSNAALSRLQFLRFFLIDKFCSSTNCFVWDCKPALKMAAQKNGKPVQPKFATIEKQNNDIL